jgi:poly-gamma-glutamate synthesis protein (capsule biosynthesis protein)
MTILTIVGLSLLILLVVAILSIIIYFFIVPIKRPRLNHSDLSEPGLLWRMYYAHKYVKAIKLPARGSAIDTYFRNLRFDFDHRPLSQSRFVSLRAVGDLMARPDLRGDHPTLWEEIGPELFKADLSIGNLECAVNPARLIHKTIRYSVRPEQADALLGDKRFGTFSIVSMGNNHVNDSLTQGINATCDYLDQAGVKHVGAGRTQKEQDEIPILKVGPARIAVLSYTFTTNGIPLEEGASHAVNVVKFNALSDRDYDPSLIHKHIRIAKQRGADYIVCCNHWGVEFEYYPPARIIRRGRDLLDAGVDLILGHHPHIVNPVDRYRTKDGRDGIIYYSLGNTTTYALKGAIKRLGAMANLTLEVGVDSKGRRVVRPYAVAATPFVYCKNKRGGAVEHRLVHLKNAYQAIASGKAPEYLSKADVRRISFAYREYDKYFKQAGLGWK